jgi:hypothetical protein
MARKLPTDVCPGIKGRWKAGSGAAASTREQYAGIRQAASQRLSRDTENASISPTGVRSSGQLDEVTFTLAKHDLAMLFTQALFPQCVARF